MRGALAQRLPQQAALFIGYHQVADAGRLSQTLAGGIEKGDPPPGASRHRLWQRQQRAQLDLEIFLVGVRVVGFVAQQFAAGSQFVAAHRGYIANTPAFIAKGSGLVEGQVIDGDHFGGAAQRDAVPAQQPGDLQVARVVHDCDQDERGWRG